VLYILTAVIAFFCEYMASSLGMGYGTALAPLMIIMGYDPLKVVSAILISQFCANVAACIAHHHCRNVDLQAGSAEFKTALLLGLMSCIGVIVSVIVAITIPRWIVTLYIGLLVISMGTLILVTRKKTIQYSRRRLLGISILASFNKGISGSGYGPLIMGGQLISGIDPKKAVGIAIAAEALTCFVGFTAYFIQGKAIDWTLVLLLVTAATLAVPLAALTVKRSISDKLKLYVGIVIIILGLVTIARLAAG
jgi:uncharacterized protein